MSRIEKIKNAIKRTAALGMSTLMAATCINASVLSVNAASGTLSDEERGVIFANSRTDFRDESIYFVMTTRFYNGDTSNDVQCWEVGPDSNYHSNYEADDPACHSEKHIYQPTAAGFYRPLPSEERFVRQINAQIKSQDALLTKRRPDLIYAALLIFKLFAREERPEHRDQDQRNNEADEYQTGTCFYVVHEFEAAGA